MKVKAPVDTGRLRNNLVLKSHRGEIFFYGRKVHYARYQDEGTITRRVSSVNQTRLWEGTGVRGRGVRLNGGIRPKNFTDEMFKPTNIKLIERVVIDVLKEQMLTAFKNNFGNI